MNKDIRKVLLRFIHSTDDDTKLTISTIRDIITDYDIDVSSFSDKQLASIFNKITTEYNESDDPDLLIDSLDDDEEDEEEVKKEQVDEKEEEVEIDEEQVDEKEQVEIDEEKVPSPLYSQIQQDNISSVEEDIQPIIQYQKDKIDNSEEGIPVIDIMIQSNNIEGAVNQIKKDLNINDNDAVNVIQQQLGLDENGIVDLEDLKSPPKFSHVNDIAERAYELCWTTYMILDKIKQTNHIPENVNFHDIEMSLVGNAYREVDNDKQIKLGELGVISFRLAKQNIFKDSEYDIKQLRDIKDYILYIKDIIIKFSDEEVVQGNLKGKKPKKSELQQFRKKILSESKQVLKSSKDIKHNLSYMHFLAAYIADTYIAINDPYLYNIFESYPYISSSFKILFSKLSPIERIKFIDQVNTSSKIASYPDRVKSQKISMNEKSINDMLYNFVQTIKQDYKHYYSCDGINKYIEEILGDIATDYSKFLINYNASDFNELTKLIIIHLYKKYNCPLDIKSTSNKLVAIIKKFTMIMADNNTDSIKANEAARKNIIEKINDMLEYEDMKDIYDAIRNSINGNVIDSFESLQNIIYQEQDISNIYSGIIEDKVIGQYYIDPIQLVSKTDISLLRKNDDGNITENLTQVTNGLLELKSLFLSNKNDAVVIMNEISNNFGNIITKDQNDEIISILKNRLDEGIISKDIFLLFNNFIKIYGDLSKFPKSTFKLKSSSKNIFNYKKISDFPYKYQHDMIVNAKREMNRILSNVEEKKLLKQVNAVILARIQQLIKSIENAKSRNAPTDELFSKIKILIQDLDLNPDLTSMLMKDADNHMIKNIYATILRLSKKVSIIRNPLQYNGNRKYHSSKNFSIKIINKIPEMNPTLSTLLFIHMTKPWLNLSNDYDFYIATPDYSSKDSLSNKLALYLGQKIYSSNKDKHMYTPTIAFWKKHCLDNHSNNKCNIKNMITTLTDKGGVSQEFVLGVYKKDFSYYRELDEKDYKKECEWFNNKKNNGLLTIAEWLNTSINSHLELEKVSIEILVNRIKKVDIDKKYLKHISCEKIVNAALLAIDQNNKLGDLIYNVEKFLFFFNPKSIIYNTSQYAKSLLEHVKDEAGLQVLFKLSFYELYPEGLILEMNDRNLLKKQFNLEVNYYVQYNASFIRKTLFPFEKPMKIAAHVISSFNDRLLNSIESSVFKNLCIDKIKQNIPSYLYFDNDENIRCLDYNDIQDVLEGKKSISKNIDNDISILFSEDDIDVKLSLILKEVEYLANIMWKDILKQVGPFNNNININNLPSILIEIIHQIEISTGIKTTKLPGMMNAIIDHAITIANNKRSAIEIDILNRFQFKYGIIQQFINDSKSRMIKYNNDPILARNDKNERKSILYRAGLIQEMSQAFNLVITDEDMDRYVDFISAKFNLPETQISKTKQSICQMCGMNAIYKTFGTFRDDKTYGIVEMPVCSSNCMDRVINRFDQPQKKTLEDINKRSMIATLLKPYMTYDDLAKFSYEFYSKQNRPIDINFSINTYNDLWSGMLLNRIILPHEILLPNIDIIKELVQYYNDIKSDNETSIEISSDNLSSTYASLFTHSKFIDDYEKVIGYYYGTGYKKYIKYTKQDLELISPGCNVPMYKVNEFIEEVALKYIKNSSNFNPDIDLINKFYKQFAEDCKRPKPDIIKNDTTAQQIKLLFDSMILSFYEKPNISLYSSIKEDELNKIKKNIIQKYPTITSPELSTKVDSFIQSKSLSSLDDYINNKLINYIKFINKYSSIKLPEDVKLALNQIHQLIYKLSSKQRKFRITIDELLKALKVNFDELSSEAFTTREVLSKLTQLFMQSVINKLSSTKYIKSNKGYIVEYKSKPITKRGKLGKKYKQQSIQQEFEELDINIQDEEEEQEIQQENEQEIDTSITNNMFDIELSKLQKNINESLSDRGILPLKLVSEVKEQKEEKVVISSYKEKKDKKQKKVEEVEEEFDTSYEDEKILDEEIEEYKEEEKEEVEEEDLLEQLRKFKDNFENKNKDENELYIAEDEYDDDKLEEEGYEYDDVEGDVF